MERSVLIFRFFVSLLIIFLICNSCVDQKIVYVDSDGNVVEEADGRVELEVFISGSEEQSRTARPVGSSAAGNNVNTVKVYAFSKERDEDDSAYAFDSNIGVEEETNPDSYSISGGNGIILITDFVSDGVEHSPEVGMSEHEDQSCTLRLKGMRVGYMYQFVAVGYNAESDYENPYGDPDWDEMELNDEATLSREVFLNAFATSVSKDGYITVDADASQSGFDVEEFFAGTSGEVLPATLGRNEIRLTRQVAGMLGYFINIPTKISDEVVRYLRVYADRTYKRFTYPAASSDLNGALDDGYDGQRQLLLDFDMSKIAENWEPDAEKQTSSMYMFYSGEDDNGFMVPDSDSDTENPAEAEHVPPLAEGYVAPPGLKLVPNSIFGGRFVIPYGDTGTSASEDVTITIVLLDEQEQDLRTYKVYMSDEEDTGNGKNYHYDIKCNNFYSLGDKASTGSIDKDKPLDLGAGSELIVTIDDGWDAVHQLENH